jgi:hypothetical protein
MQWASGLVRVRELFYRSEVRRRIGSVAMSAAGNAAAILDGRESCLPGPLGPDGGVPVSDTPKRFRSKSRFVDLPAPRRPISPSTKLAPTAGSPSGPSFRKLDKVFTSVISTDASEKSISRV